MHGRGVRLASSSLTKWAATGISLMKLVAISVGFRKFLAIFSPGGVSYGCMESSVSHTRSGGTEKNPLYNKGGWGEFRSGHLTSLGILVKNAHLGEPTIGAGNRLENGWV